MQVQCSVSHGIGTSQTLYDPGNSNSGNSNSGNGNSKM
jgi:hypothetical protein